MSNQHHSNKRRSFIKSSVSGALGASLIPTLGNAFEGKEQIDYTKNMQGEAGIIGHGDFRYRLNKEWGTQNLAKYPVMDCHEMVQDQKGRLLLLTNHPKNNLLIYDRSGKVLDTWTLGLQGAHGLTLSEEGGEEFLYIAATTDHMVLKTDMKGNILLKLEYPKETGKYESEEKYVPTETAIAPNGDIYVADGYGLDYIMQYDAKGNFIRYWGGKGEGKNNLDCCHGVTLDTRDKKNPTLLITSRSKQEFKRFTLDGQHLETIQMPGSWICRPVIKGENLYFAVLVTKTWGAYDGCIAVLDKDNKVVSMPGASTPKYENGLLMPPQYDDFSFLNPHDVCIDNDGNIYIPQWMSGRTYPYMLERV
jgi:hypothetical protein